MASPKVPFVDLRRIHDPFRSEFRRALKTTLDEGQYILGSPVDRFEAQFARFIGTRRCITVASGCDALILALRALGIKEGDKVATVSHTFVATVDAILHVGAKPVLVDVERDSGNLDPSKLRKIIRKVDAVIPVDLYGNPARMREIQEIADGAEVPVVEDACQAHGAKEGKRNCGTFGQAAAFSFYPGKNLGALGDGGAITTDDDELAAELRLLRNYGQRAKYDHQRVGWNSRLDTLQAAILSVKLAYLRGWNRQRRIAAKRYDEFLADANVTLHPERGGSRHVRHIYAVRVQMRDKIRDQLVRQGIGASVHYPKAVHEFPPYAGLIENANMVPESEAWARETLSLPMFPGIRENEIETVADGLIKATRRG